MPRSLRVGAVGCGAWLLLDAPLAFAQYARSEGVFTGPQLTVRTVLLDREKGTVAASVALSQGSCSGSVAGSAPSPNAG